LLNEVFSKKNTTMEKLIIEIGASQNHFGGFATNVEGVYGAGNTLDECKANILEGLRLLINNREKSQTAVPKWLVNGEYEIEYRYDVQSILNYYANVFTKPALERLTGINQKQLHHYATGLKKPREPQRKKIELALHRLGSELLSVHFS
jgi:predicted RNase H-like HicB family nuclease